MTGFWFGFIVAIVLAWLYHKGHLMAEERRRLNDKNERKYGFRIEEWDE